MPVNSSSRQPIPVCLTRKDLKGELERAIESSYMHQNKGTCTYVLRFLHDMLGTHSRLDR